MITIIHAHINIIKNNLYIILIIKHIMYIGISNCFITFNSNIHNIDKIICMYHFYDMLS